MSHRKNKENRLIKKWNIIHLYGDSCKYKKEQPDKMAGLFFLTN